MQCQEVTGLCHFLNCYLEYRESDVKNYVKKGQKLPLYGIGPYLIAGIGAVTLTGILLCVFVFRFGYIDGIWNWVFRIAGIILMVTGAAVWYIGALRSNMNKNISENRLQTSGIYEWVRNPMYSGWWILITGIGLMWSNLMILPTVLFNWLILTIVLKNTEEKWLTDLYGREYEEYKKKVNRCIPWFPR